ncbi:hypothetical protein JKP88DRAFT_252415 [Tribonema minus]|uniref:Uncharacterized protein n=1 Tax=Tribonema minus TaxID=303371 RepID=A0A835Z9C8_9STRA|nr:hypothetical protein JKP88DRAFT_252415 [Tribonema minus]
MAMHQAKGEELRKELVAAAEQWSKSTRNTGAGHRSSMQFNVTVTSTVRSGSLGGALTSVPGPSHSVNDAAIGIQVSDLKSLFGDVQDAKAARAILLQHQGVLDTVYSAACGPMQGGAGGLSLVDFVHCVHTCELLHAYSDVATCRRLFGDTVGGEVQSDGGRRMSRGAFNIAMTRLAQYKGGAKAIATLESLLEGKVTDQAKRIAADPADAALLGPGLEGYLAENTSLLQAIFLLYAAYGSDGNRTRQAAETSGRQAVVILCICIEAAPPEGYRQEPPVFSVLVERSFFGAQGSPKPLLELKELTFFECVRAAARLAVASLGDGKTVEAKIELVLDAFVELGLGNVGLK